jgi:hypothetical protein
MTSAWASLQEAAETIRAAGVENSTEVIRRAVSAALIVRPGALPLPDRKPPAPRFRVISERTPVGMDWLQAPVLDFEKSEILCRSYMAGTDEEFRYPRDVHPARIELWNDDLLRLWPPASVQPRPEASASATISPSGIQTNKQAEAKANCISWISAMPEQPARRKPDVMADAKVVFPKLSGRQFNAAWDVAAPAAWKNPGPKRSEHH